MHVLPAANQCALGGRQSQMHALPIMIQCAIEVRQFHGYEKLSVNQSVIERGNFQVHMHQGGMPRRRITDRLDGHGMGSCCCTGCVPKRVRECKLGYYMFCEDMIHLG